MTFRVLGAVSVLSLIAGGALADPSFKRIASFPVVENMAEGEDKARESSPEIIAATEDGMTLIYTDSPLGVVGMVDITDPANPAPLGNIALDGEPTSVAVSKGFALVGVNTSESYTAPSGHLATINIADKAVTETCSISAVPPRSAWLVPMKLSPETLVSTCSDGPTWTELSFPSPL